MGLTLLGRLAPKTQGWDRSAPSTADRLSVAEIAGALSGLPALHAHYALYVYAGDNSSRDYLRWHGIVELSRIALAQRWRLKEGRIGAMVDLAIRESTGARRCPRCHGAELAAMDCIECSGSGISNYTERERARLMQIDPKTWRVSYRGRYLDYAYPIYSPLTDVIRRHLRKQLRP